MLDHERGHVPYGSILRAWDDSNLIPFLGAAVSKVSTDGKVAASGQLPDGKELSRRLATHYGYDGDIDNLAKVSQYGIKADENGYEGFRRTLREILLPATHPNDLHKLLADASSTIKLFVTTNYDTLLERALLSARGGRKFYVVFNVPRNVKGPHYFGFKGGEDRDAEYLTDDELARIDLGERPVVFKMHGTLSDFSEKEWEDFVITEDDYTAYLSDMPIPTRFFPDFAERPFLFLGCSLEDQNLRVLLHRLRKHKKEPRSWAIQLNVRGSDHELWLDRGVRVCDVPIDRFVRELIALRSGSNSATNV